MPHKVVEAANGIYKLRLSEDRQRAPQVGFDRYLGKPVNFGQSITAPGAAHADAV